MRKTLALVAVFLSLVGGHAYAAPNGLDSAKGNFSLPSIALNMGGADGIEGAKPTELVNVLKIVLLLTVLTLAPAILVMMTSFTRIVIVLSFLRQSLGAQQMPPNQVIVGLSLFLSMFVMAPTWTKIQETALTPFSGYTNCSGPPSKSCSSTIYDSGVNQIRSGMG